MLACSTRPILRCISGRRTLSVKAVKDGQKPMSKPQPKKVEAPKETKKSKEENRIKRAPSAFNLFVKSAFPKAKQEGPELSFAELSDVVRAKWKGADAATKAPFEKQAAELKAATDQKRAAARAEKKANAKPLGAYMMFATKVRSDVVARNPGKSAQEIASLLGAAWKKLSPEEQQKYRDEAKAQMDAWKAKQGSAA